MFFSQPRASCILVLGNPGVGKSTIANALVEQLRFREGTGAEAVTTKVEKCKRKNDRDEVYDLPGLSEAGGMNAERNASSVHQAVKDIGRTPTKVILVVSAQGGRVSADDVSTWTLFSAYLRGVASSVAVVVNKVDDDSFDSLSEQKEWEESFMRAFYRSVPELRGQPYVFIPQLPKAMRYEALQQRVDGVLARLQGAFLNPTNDYGPVSVAVLAEKQAAELRLQRRRDEEARHEAAREAQRRREEEQRRQRREIEEQEARAAALHREREEAERERRYLEQQQRERQQQRRVVAVRETYYDPFNGHGFAHHPVAHRTQYHVPMGSRVVMTNFGPAELTPFGLRLL